RFKVRHMMITNASGDITGIKGKFELNDADISKTKIEATMETKTISTHNRERDKHLRGADFFDVKKYPQIKFQSTKVEKSGDKWKVTGNLTLHGVTRPIQLDANVPTMAVKDPWGTVRRGFYATTKLSRRQFGLTWNQVLESGAFVVGDEV